MSPLPCLSLLLIQVLILAGCSSISQTIQPAQEMIIPSPTNLPATEMVTPTWTPAATETPLTPSPTATKMPLATLDPKSVKETIQPLLIDPLNCSVPCFWGIIPGKTRMDEARIFFSPLGFTPFQGTEVYSGRDFYTIEFETGFGLNAVTLFYSDNGFVENIIVRPDITKQKEGSPREWIAFSPETLIKKYGKPSRVDFYLAWPGGGGSEIIMTMYFDASDLIVQYTGENMLPSSNHSPRLCPLTAPFDYVRLWLGTEPPNRPLAGVPLEQATSLAVDQFTQLMLGDSKQACFTLNGDAFQ